MTECSIKQESMNSCSFLFEISMISNHLWYVRRGRPALCLFVHDQTRLSVKFICALRTETVELEQCGLDPEGWMGSMLVQYGRGRATAM